MSDDSAAKLSEIVWSPQPAVAERSQLRGFMQAAAQQSGRQFDDYEALWQWSVDEPAGFWAAVWAFCGVIASQPYAAVLRSPHAMPGARWFEGARLNFAENLLRYGDDRPALIFRGEDGEQRALSYAQLREQAGRLAAAMRAMGVGAGDRVAAIMPNIPEAVIGMLATTWIGAVWSSCSPDFGADGILDRFGQIEPRLLLAASGYRFKGKPIDIRGKIQAVRDGLDAPHECLVVDWPGIGHLPGARDWADVVAEAPPAPPFLQVPFDHPAYILFSSGTTGRPKCIVHGAGGTLLQHLKEHRLHCDIRRDDRLFYFTTCGWMMWNWLVSGLASGTTLVLFDGNPLHPSPDALWRTADELGVTVFGTSAKYLSAQQKAGVRVVDTLPLKKLRCILSTGSPLAPESYDYVLDAIRPGVQISSVSGGTDIVSCFALGNPLLPVRRGELQCRGLGMAVDVFDADGNSLRDAPGELVCTRPFPSMPVGFWADTDGRRFRAAYFERFPGVWTHGDWTVLSGHGGLIITGRSDAVLNPGGVRIGTAEIYRQVERLPQVRESVCIGQPWDGDVRVVLFVVLEPGSRLDDALRAEIRRVLRTHASPRHVPAKILEVDDIPRTRSGKISELAVRDTVAGRPVANTGALANPEVLAQYRERPELALP
jgi:acetoacetyl-CoA synthetase